MINMTDFNAAKFDQLVEQIFNPIYPVVAAQIVNSTGIATGICLDAGSAGGYLGIAIAKITNLDVYLLDISPAALQIATCKISQLGLETRVHPLLGNVQEIPIRDNTVDLVVSKSSVWFWDNKPKAFQELYRILRPGGIAYVGGSFGTAEIKQQVTAVMRQTDKNWDWRRVGNDKTPDKMTEILLAAKIPAFKILSDDWGLWAVIKK